MSVTFIIPVHDGEATIADAIAAVQAQSVADWRLIIADDASTDATPQIIARAAEADGRISVITLPECSGGALMPRLRAAEAAITEFIAPLDADDSLAPDYLAYLLASFDEASAAQPVDIAYPTMYRMHGTEISHIPCLDSLENSVYGRPMPGREAVRYTLDGWRVGCNGGIIRKSAYLAAAQKMKEYVEDFGYIFSDELHTRFLLREARGVVWCRAGYGYRMEVESVSRRLSPGRFSYMMNNRTLIRFCATEFGADSQEYLLAQRQNFHGVFDAIRLLLNGKGSGRDVCKAAFSQIRQSLAAADMESLKKGKAGPRYMILFRLLRTLDRKT